MNTQESQLCEEITEFEKDSKWFYENTDLLRKRKLSGKFVAINNKEVIASGESFDIVVEEVEHKGKNPAYVVIEYVYPEGTVVLF
ncbi:hypothetical protein J4402_01125 [Candidatus Pacearchaeota archaeon]|nr:hypothetical protein [Candidatus Pacearchaeota archaeon]